MTEVLLYGAPYSVYVRSVRLALEEKQVAYRLIDVDVYAPEGPPPAYLALHPFGRIPAFEHDGFRLYESRAITRYIDEVFAGPSLQPSAPRDRARMMQVLGILDSYAYRPLIWDIYVERVVAPDEGRTADEGRIAAALPRAAMVLSVIEDLMGEANHLAGSALTLADLHAAPMIAYLRLATEGAQLLRRHPGIMRWWDQIATRPSMKRTAFRRERP